MLLYEKKKHQTHHLIQLKNAVKPVAFHCVNLRVRFGELCDQVMNVNSHVKRIYSPDLFQCFNSLV